MESKQWTEQAILYVDDDQDDVEMLQNAINIIDPTMRLSIATDGVEGLQQLAEMKSNLKLPRLIVLDINMPRMDGRLTFLKIKEDRELSAIPIVIFSTSKSQLDKMFFKGDNVEYITKPIQFSHFVDVAKKLIAYTNYPTDSSTPQSNAI